MTIRTADPSPAVPFTTIVTAAGAGHRMGGPKALLAVQWGEGAGELPLALAHAKAHLDGGAERVVLVTRAEVARTLSRFAQRGLDILVSNQGHALGESGSIRCALALLELPPEAWVVIAPVDTPPMSIMVRRSLLTTAAATPSLAAVRPTFGGVHGAPILVQRRYLDPLCGPDDPPQLNDVLASLGGRVLDVEVDDPRTTTRFAAPSDVQAFYGAPARFFIEDEPTLA